MNKMSTFEATRNKRIYGNMSCEKAVKQILPILIRQAKAKQFIYYVDLYKETGIGKRNLNFPLGIIGHEINRLRKIKNVPIPPLQFIVINQHHNIPGEGILDFLDAREKSLWESGQEYRKTIFDKKIDEIYNYNQWDDILTWLNIQDRFSTLSIKEPPGNHGHGSGESDDHKRFKEYVSKNYKQIGIHGSFNAILEHEFITGDKVDILLLNKKKMIAVEIKSKISDELDIRRGLLQCIKYYALLEAENKMDLQNKAISTILVIEGIFPTNLTPIKNILHIDVIEQVATGFRRA